jgi:hypothetical protein
MSHVPGRSRPGQRKDGKDVDAPGECLPGFRHGGVPRRTGEDIPAWPEIPVEQGLDCVKQLGDMLIFVDQDRLVGLDEPARVIPDGGPCRWVVAVSHRAPEASGQLAQQRTLANGARTVQDQYRLLGQAGSGDRSQPTLRHARQDFSHTMLLAAKFSFSVAYFPFFHHRDSANSFSGTP